MDDKGYKEVYFHEYCPKCKHKKVEDGKWSEEGPCDECLENPTNLHSHKPINYEEK